MLQIIDFIPYGKENAKTAEELADTIGTSEREVRRMINEARRENVVLNMQDGNGYFRPTEKEKDLAERWLKQEESRLKLHALALRAVRRSLKEVQA